MPASVLVTSHVRKYVMAKRKWSISQLLTYNSTYRNEYPTVYMVNMILKIEGGGNLKLTVLKIVRLP